MAGKFPSAKSAELCRALEAFGFQRVKVEGSHYFYLLPDANVTSSIQVPYHSFEISPVTVKAFAKRLNREYGVSFEEFLIALKSGKARKLSKQP